VKIVTKNVIDQPKYNNRQQKRNRSVGWKLWLVASRQLA